MKLGSLIVTAAAALTFASVAYATMPGKTAEFAGGAMGKVTFDGKIHADAGLACNDCHTAIFQMKREVKIGMANHNDGTFCFSCHKADGKAFAAAGNCAKCHKK